jgi:ABC-type Zn2+ transport system substrate-binding protein/surface adhesin
MTEINGSKEAEQIQIARAIGQELTDAFVAFVRGRIEFDALTFGVYDAMSDLHAVASGDYELAPDTDDDHDHEHHHHGHHHHHDHEHGYDDAEATEEQEDLAQEPARDAEG